ncbi:sensor histidine kinase [Tepidibacter formicigenes]|jgi:two-component system sensor histidine kinase YcbA|uniref:histidine kinase n=1 Tax=Tepidibacter formicigenes DSM 15518 TaxID=1123349 RepID=A0A1M6LBC3_9FIRM|nr:sensor histidine kinase [Tepidibacter formicigenes]SHJ68468.1 two-component system, sensor histidine kinase YcbA [Tepidibacter formicigenes DSM 15518]
MKKIKSMMIIALTVSFVSQIYINLLINNFRVSVAVIFFSIFLIFFNRLNIITTSIFTSGLVFLFRFLIYSFINGNLYDSFIMNYPVVFFYLSYGILFRVFNIRKQKNIYRIFLCFWISDFVSNIWELLFRINFELGSDIYSITKILAGVALFRSILTLIAINIIKKYNILLEKEEHEERYRKLIFLISSLKSEVYFMNKNMDNIEEVMTKSFRLYEILNDSNIQDNTKELSLSITKDIHEIKKDYVRVIKGIEEFTNIKSKYKKMSLNYIFNILEDSTKKFINSSGKNIDIVFKNNVDIQVKDHYMLISILRNLINNSIEAMDNLDCKGIIVVTHFNTSTAHVFTVYDNGKGIKDRDKEYIFNAGFSTKFDINTGDINRGIGLTIVKEMVENHFGGKIKVNSKYKDGTTFEILIPKDKLRGDGGEFLYS